MKCTRRTSAIGAVLVLCLALPAWAQKGDPEAGRVKAATCMGCHGIKDYSMVYPTYHVPKLGGQHAAYISAALKAYAKGNRDFATMHAQAASLSEQDIADIAAFLSQAPKE
ncbi:MAG: c-type cytochrome [Salinisphaera sp.]|nr:c-type cytochrome [Salinisphaera sp.]